MWQRKVSAMRCPCCGWGEVDVRSVDGAEVCEACETASLLAQTEGREEVEA